MTIRDLYEYALIEMNKVEAPSLLLEDFNYFINKAVQQYINKVYNRYDINQQSSDDLRVLKATVDLTPEKKNTPTGGIVGNRSKFTYTVNLPDDYMHLLNCIVEYEVLSPFKCYAAGDHVDFPARRLTADMAAGILHNVYMKPDYKRPYYYINNINLEGYDSLSNIPTSERTSANTPVGRAMRELYDRYGCQMVLTNPTILKNGLGDFLENTNMNRILRTQIGMVMDAGVGMAYYEQLKKGSPDNTFVKRVKDIITRSCGFGDDVTIKIMGYFDEMIGWKAAEARYYNASTASLFR